MSGSVTPMAGMGTTGSTMGSPYMLSPQILQMLMARAQMGGGGMGAPGMGQMPGPMNATPMAPSGAPTPMTSPSMIRGPMNNVGPMPQMPMGGGAPQGAPQMAPQSPFAALMNNPQLRQALLQAFAGGQTGINPLAGVSQGQLQGFNPMASG